MNNENAHLSIVHSTRPLVSRLRVTHYRSCVSTRLTFQPDLSVLIGPNGSGKTNILTSLVMLRNLALEYPSRRAEAEGADACRITADFSLGARELRMLANVQFHTDDRNADAIVTSEQHWRVLDKVHKVREDKKRKFELPLWYVRDFRNRFAHRYLNQNPAGAIVPPHKRAGVSDKLFDQVSKIANTLSTLQYYSASQFTNPSRCPVSFEIEPDVATLRGRALEGHRRFLLDLYNGQNGKYYSTFLSAVGSDGIGLVDEIKFQEIRTSAIDVTVASGGRVERKTRERILIIPQFFIGKNVLSPNQLSEGTFKTISLLYYVITQESGLLLIEEPEVCVHHGLLSSIMELIKAHSKKQQIIISTHSDFVLDQVEPRNVLIVKRTAKAGTTVKSLEGSMPARALAALRKYLKNEGNLGEYWRHGGLD